MATAVELPREARTRPWLDRAITWTVAGAATAAAALAHMFAVVGFLLSIPAADNVGEDSTGEMIGAACIVVAPAIALPTGWVLARKVWRSKWLRALPLAVSVAWTLLAGLLLPFGVAALAAASLGALSQLVTHSVLTAGALPIGIVLLVAYLVLLVVRAARKA
ncbi:hypothetical protein [Microbacterium sp. RG1]|uniref:hypothetical protein n=1 Tax=Microbacterium sp. RG1 TaxID=2489212 RepID=UPI0010CA5AF4|nr:hypothetical protein [Microbacterium sp. RG1]QCQ15841.1 hypothetical protein EHF32_03330 [Microbacterium sp. RG1]